MAKQVSLAQFKKNIVESGILDPEGIHHEFVSGLHGRKLDFDAIADDSDLFQDWVLVVAQSLRELYPKIEHGKLALLSVANGTNRLVGPVAKELGGGVTALLTEKVSPKAVRLTGDSRKKLRSLKPELVVAIEDVGTRGTTSASAVVSAREAGAARVEALNTWQRRPQLEELDAIGAVYHSIIHEELETLTPAECQADGYCAKGWKYIKHD